MLTVTNSAWQRLSKFLVRHPKVVAIRLKFADGVFRCGPGSQQDGDRLIQQRDRPPILMSPSVARDLASRTLDAPDSGRGPRLQLVPEAPPTEPLSDQ